MLLTPPSFLPTLSSHSWAVARNTLPHRAGFRILENLPPTLTPGSLRPRPRLLVLISSCQLSALSSPPPKSREVLGLTKGHMGLRPWPHQPHASTPGNPVPWHTCPHTYTYAHIHVHAPHTRIHCWPLGMCWCSQAAITLLQTESSTTQSGVCTPRADSQLPSGTATEAAMRSTCWEAFLLAMNSRLPAANSRDRGTYTHTHTDTLRHTHSYLPIVRGHV